MSLTLVFGLLAGALVLSWGWLEGRLLPDPSPLEDDDLQPAQQAFDSGDLDRAIVAARQILNTDPDRTDALVLLVRALIYRSYSDYDRAVDREIALRFTGSAIERLPFDSDVLAIHAFALQAQGQAVQANEFASRALLMDSENVLARIALGLSFAGVGSYERALMEAQKAVNTGEYPLDALRALAIGYSDLGRYAEAAATVERALALNDRLPMLYYERALYALQVSDADAATVAYFRILTQQPENVKARLRMCELSTLMRRHEEAVQYCSEVTGLAPNWSDGWYRLGREYYLQGDYASALRYLNRCTQLQINQRLPAESLTFECWYLQGQSAEILNNCPALLQTYNEYLSLSAAGSLPQTWVYPPEGPSICARSEAAPAPVITAPAPR